MAVSGIVAGAALKGPADRMLASLGHEVSALGVARLYAELADAFLSGPGVVVFRNAYPDPSAIDSASDLFFRIIDEQHTRARQIIEQKREALDKIAQALLQYETIEGRHQIRAEWIKELRTKYDRVVNENLVVAEYKKQNPTAITAPGK